MANWQRYQDQQRADKNSTTAHQRAKEIARLSAGSRSSSFGAGGGSSFGGGSSVTSYKGPSQSVQDSMNALVAGFNKSYGEARSANEARYQQMLGIADATTNQRASDITQSSFESQANMMQGLARLGMQNTTVAPTMKAGIDREREASLNRNADQQQQTKLGIIERRTDRYPDASGLQSILSGVMSQYGGGKGIAPTLKSISGMQQ